MPATTPPSAPLSYVAPGSPWLDDLCIGQVLAQQAKRYPRHDALVFPHLGLRWTYAEFDAQVDRVARALLALGLRPGDHLAVWATNVPEWVFLQFASARVGVVLVTINPAYRPFELRYVLKQSDAQALFLIDAYKKSDYFGMLAEVCPEIMQPAAGLLENVEFPRLKSVVALREGVTNRPAGIQSWNDFLAAGERTTPARLQEIEASLRPGDPINIQYTSGTTGFPKAAMLSHRNLLLNVYYAGQALNYTAADRICIPVPFYHCFGCVLGTLCAVAHGAAMIIPAESFDPGATLQSIEAERATSLYGVPTMFIAQLHNPSLQARDLTSLRTGIMAGSPCPIETMRCVVEEMHCPEITIGYGQTEASPLITQTTVDDPLELRVETVGRAFPGVEVKIIDPATGDILPDGQPGELCSRGHNTMLGYYNQPEATAAAIDAEGWLHTGDLAIRLPNGYFKITGRIKDMVIRGGENIYPREIEEYFFTHPAIEQASVVGVPDPKYGEELCAWIKLKSGYAAGADLTEEQVRDFCRGKLAHYKVPRYVRFVQAFPQTVTGKIQKFKIREQMCAELGLCEQKTA
ncbi:MAG: AMP-binding protein [Pirellulales bacterium]|nr:AMP-binding protein [Pirellulales bacterium]